MTEQATILIVEDEEKIARLLSDYLEKIGGYRTQWVARGDEALQAFEASSPDLVLLDLMLPGMDGLQVCRALRAQSRVPIIMVTALVEEIDRLLGLELGADDYIRSWRGSRPCCEEPGRSRTGDCHPNCRSMRSATWQVSTINP
jgi:two-component system response regulator BaeR